MTESILNALAGGVLIGISVTLMLWLNGRVTGISGIINSVLCRPRKESLWRFTFLAGLLVGGGILYFVNPSIFANTTERSMPEVAVAGLLVGFGTVLGSGCTSGHGVCGISRLSVRSVVATVVFILSGIAAVQLIKNLF